MLMGQPTSHAMRVAIVKRHEAGETLAQIATSMQLSAYTVRTYWRRYRTRGWAAIQPPRTGPPMTGPLGQAHHRVKYVLLRLKRQHPGWGVDKLRLELTRRSSLQGITIPQRSALAAYLAGFRARLYRPRRRPTRRPPDPARPVATQPHQGWQIDFKGDEPVLGVGRVAPLMVCDTGSGAPLAGIIHTVRARGNQQGLTARVVQADLRGVFTQWGLPDVLQVDNDSRFIGSTRREWPGVLLLWLIGLGVQPHINRVYRPTDNAIVERNHQTWMAHVVVAQHYADVAALQAATDAAFADRIDALPTRNPRCGGQPPSVAFPQLRTPRRPYDPTQEAALFDLTRVDAYLAGWRWQRTVDSAGKISLADRNYRVGTAYAGQVVQVQYDPTERACVGRLADGTEVLRQAIPEFDGDWICGVHLTLP
jgi:transposase